MRRTPRLARPVIDRASPTDMISLATDVGPAPMQIGAVVVLDVGPGFQPERLEDVIAERILLVPRLRQRLVRTPFGCGRPVWLDDPGFDVTRHLRRMPCPAPGDRQALLDVAAGLVADRLPWSAPPWSATVVTGLAGDQVALVVVFHHVLADGIGGLAVLAGLVDAPTDAVPEPTPRTAVSRRALAMNAWAGRLRAVARPVRIWSSVRLALAELAVRPERAPRCSLNRPIGARRGLAVVTVDLARLRAAAHAPGGTVNDALLAAVVGGLRALLERRGEQVDMVTMTVPVSRRRRTGADRLGNAVGIMPLSLPTTGDARSRLRRVAAITRAHKSAAPGASAVVVGVMFRALATLGVLGWWIDHQRLVHTFVTNLRGPDHEVTLAGQRVSAIVPVSAISGNVTVAFAALSYAGTLAVTMIADPDRVPDLPVLAAALRAELAELATGEARGIVEVSSVGAPAE